MAAKKLRHGVRPVGSNKLQPSLVSSSHSKLMKFDELLLILDLPKSTLRYYIAIELIPSIKIGRHRRFIYDDVMKAIKKL